MMSKIKMQTYCKYKSIKYLLALIGFAAVCQVTSAYYHEIESDIDLIPSKPDATPARTTRAVSSTLGPTLAPHGGSTNHTMDVIVHEREFVSQKVKVGLDCIKDRTIIKLNFTSPFRGVLGAGKLGTTTCTLYGNGTRFYELQVPHSSPDCGTELDHNSGSIFNTLFIRFHSSLELGGDIAKNIMCRMHLGDLVVGKKNIKMPKTTRQPTNEPK